MVNMLWQRELPRKDGFAFHMKAGQSALAQG